MALECLERLASNHRLSRPLSLFPQEAILRFCPDMTLAVEQDL